MNKDTIKQYLDFTKDNLKSKKNIFLISLLITMSITFIYISLGHFNNLMAVYQSTFISIFSVSAVISLMIDFSFVFSKEEINYYLGKPTTLYSITLKKIVANLSYAFFLLLSFVPLYVIEAMFDIQALGSALEFYLTVSYKILIIYSAIIIGFLISSSLVSGVLASIVIYFLPGIALTIFDSYALTISNFIYGNAYDITRLSSYTKGLSYFYEGVIFDIDAGHPLYYLNMIFVATTLFLVIRVITKKRKNEVNNSGIIFHGLQNLLTVSLCVMFAGNVFTLFSLEFIDISYLNRILVYILVFYLVYFVATIVLNKTLKITKDIIFKATKSLVVVVTICFGIYGFFSLQIYKIPNAEELAHVEVNSDMGFDYGTNLYGGLVITNQEDIQKVIDLNKKILKSKYSQNDGRIVFKYVYKSDNPKVVIRSFQKKLVTVEDSKNLNYHLTEGEFSDDVKGLTGDESFIEAILDTLVIDYDSEYYTLETSYLHIRKDKLNYQVPYTEEFIKIFREEAKIYIQEHGTFYDITNSMTSGDSIFGEFNVDSTRLRIRFSNGRIYSRQFRLVDGYFDKTIKYIKDNSPTK